MNEPCKTCGTVFVKNKHNQLYCSDPCKRSFFSKSKKENYKSVRTNNFFRTEDIKSMNKALVSTLERLDPQYAERRKYFRQYWNKNRALA